ncbi:thermonuclease family protein [Roseitalea porphyridii]|uniref:Thermonuclease family protein n=2 Tax=Roseitalea porphyridii TaxID=1852022 RepID=A0A4P6V3K9_9HYPH|nr:thermonuclease family protein [Roseitalea porphyridii]
MPLMGRGRRRVRDLVTAALLIGAVTVTAAALQDWNSRTLEGTAVVTDGDTIRLMGEPVRLRGIDAPELEQLCIGGDGAEHACGRLSSAYLETLIAARPVACIGHDTDRYGRFLGDCRAGAGATATDLNEAMVASGWAVAYGDHERAEARARGDKRGLWAWEFERPADWRRRVAAETGESVPAGGAGAFVRRARALVGWSGHNE